MEREIETEEGALRDGIDVSSRGEGKVMKQRRVGIEI